MDDKQPLPKKDGLSADSPSSMSRTPSPNPQETPAPAYEASRTLHIYKDGLTHRHLTIADEDKNHPLYTIAQNSGSAFSSKPHMTITSVSSSLVSNSGTTIGTATFHTYSSTVDMTLHDHTIPLESSGIFSRAYGYQSPAFGEPLKWERDGFWGADLVLVNAQNEWIARFDAGTWSMSKSGKLMIANGGISGFALDEIVVTGCAMVQKERRTKQNKGACGGGFAAGMSGGNVF